MEQYLGGVSSATSLTSLSPPPVWGVRETKDPAPRNTRYYSLLGKEVWRIFRELRECELLRTPKRRSSLCPSPIIRAGIITVLCMLEYEPSLLYIRSADV